MEKDRLLQNFENILRKENFVFIPRAGELVSSKNHSDDARLRYAAHWDDLQVDENFKSYTDRRRRLLRYDYTHPGVFELNPDPVVRPKVNYNITYKRANNHLRYATQAFIDDPLTRAMIEMDLRLIEFALVPGQRLAIDIHQFRVSSTEGRPSPTTSGRHQDGEDYVFMHFVNADNVKPVVSEVHADQTIGDALFSHAMTEFLDTLVVNDRKLYHSASPVEPQQAGRSAHRDLLLVCVSALEARG